MSKASEKRELKDRAMADLKAEAHASHSIDREYFFKQGQKIGKLVSVRPADRSAASANECMAEARELASEALDQWDDRDLGKSAAARNMAAIREGLYSAIYSNIITASNLEGAYK